MALFVWCFRLSGNSGDIARLLALVGDPMRIGSTGELEIENGYGPSDSAMVRSVVEGLVARLNGAAKIMDLEHRFVKIDGHKCIGAETGTEVGFIVGRDSDSIPSQARFGGPNLDELLANAALQRSATNEPLSRALNLFGRAENWVDLYNVLDAIKSAREKLSNCSGWPSKKCVEDFTSTANSYMAIGENARHGKLSGVEKPRMNLEEAKRMIWTMMRIWAESLDDKRRG